MAIVCARAWQKARKLNRSIMRRYPSPIHALDANWLHARLQIKKRSGQIDAAHLISQLFISSTRDVFGSKNQTYATAALA